jgi:methylenetetrahydrofolate reductase (NADPH)
MLRVLQNDLLDPRRFLITLELVPGREPFGQSVDTVKGLAADAFADGRISAVSITDNPGGNPSLSPDVIGHEIFRVGMDVIVHFACRDMNRAGMESRALQLALMGMKNILALTGDYTGRGFGGRGAPVFDLDSVNLLIMLSRLGERVRSSGDPDAFFAGVAVSPFKYTAGESYAQYAKLCRKAAAGARFVITQLGYDVRKYDELLRMKRYFGLELPVFGSVYLLSPRAARAMNRGKVPGVFVPDSLLELVLREWTDPRQGLSLAVERAARLAAVLKGLGYRGIHIGGVHRSFKTVARILDRLAEIQEDWRSFTEEFSYGPPRGFYAFPPDAADDARPGYGRGSRRLPWAETVHYRSLEAVHDWFFNHHSPLAPYLEKACRFMERRTATRHVADLLEGIPKKVLLDCRRCGDCGIQHAAFLCPESQCPKHIRNGACGGSREGRCEVFPEKPCLWFRAYRRLASANRLAEMSAECVPPRMWALDRTPSWINFHLKRDHQADNRFAGWCRPECDGASRK